MQALEFRHFLWNSAEPESQATESLNDFHQFPSDSQQARTLHPLQESVTKLYAASSAIAKRAGSFSDFSFKGDGQIFHMTKPGGLCDFAERQICF